MSFKHFLTESNKEITIFWDMDMVLCDFSKSFISRYPNISKEELVKQEIPDDEFWPMVHKIPNFWENLDTIPSGIKLLKYVSDNGFNVEILSSPSSHDDRSIPGKKIWIKKNLSNFNISNVNLVTSSKKKNFAHSKAILIDDLKKNVDEFKGAGGHVIHFNDAKNHLPELKKLIAKVKKSNKITESVEMSNAQVLTEKQIVYNNGAKYGQVVFLSGGAGCFTGETVVSTENGYTKIKDVKEGTKVWTINEETKEKELKEVEKNTMYESHEENLLELTFDNGETVVCTESHEFYVDGKWIKAKDM